MKRGKLLIEAQIVEDVKLKTVRQMTNNSINTFQPKMQPSFFVIRSFFYRFSLRGNVQDRQFTRNFAAYEHELQLLFKLSFAVFFFRSTKK